MSLIRASQRMLDLLDPAERRQGVLLVPLVALHAVTQAVGVASVMPFLAVVGDPDAAMQTPPWSLLHQALGTPGVGGFTAACGLATLVLLIVGNAVAAATNLFMLRYSWQLNHALSMRMLRTYLRRPYASFLDTHTAGLAKNLLGEVRFAVRNFLVAGLELASRGAVVLAILVLLLIVEPALALASFVLLGVAYLGLYGGLQRGMAQAGEERSQADSERYRAASEALSGVKEIQFLRRERAFLARYGEPSKRYAALQARQEVVARMPRYLFEVLAFGGLVGVVLWFGRGESLAALLPTAGVFAYAAYRLLPALQGVFAALAKLRFSAAAVEALHADLAQPSAGDLRPPVQPLVVEGAIELRDVAFRYPGADEPTLDGLSLRLEAGSSVALVGATAAGKSTVVDLLLGVLRPDRGALVVAGQPVDDDTVERWQACVGYVPQVIHLLDDSVRTNIVFGLDGVTDAKVREATRRAGVHDEIEGSWSDGYDTRVGERGVRLSGGERQRLGIARALLAQPEVLVLDEATSALDGPTERRVFEGLAAQPTLHTLIVVAHRMSTAKRCDRIVVLDGGRVVGDGTHDELLRDCPAYQALDRADRGEAASP